MPVAGCPGPRAGRWRLGSRLCVPPFCSLPAPPGEACSSSQTWSLCGAPSSARMGFGLCLQVPCPWLMRHGDHGDSAGGFHADLRVRPHCYQRSPGAEQPLLPGCAFPAGRAWTPWESMRSLLRGAPCTLMPEGRQEVTQKQPPISGITQ